jgi:hypothetical protein
MIACIALVAVCITYVFSWARAAFLWAFVQQLVRVYHQPIQVKYAYLKVCFFFASQVGICSIPTRHTLTKAVVEQTKFPETNSGCVMSSILPLLPDQLLATHVVQTK